jgi:3,4-dihydroxy 2-butanone 4-phosphate synthase/GTP cyclohydrolase II
VIALRSVSPWEREVDVEAAIAAIAAGSAVIVLDEEAAAPTGLLVIAAEALSERWMERFVRHTSGLVRVAAAGERIAALGLEVPESSVALRDGPPPASARGRAAAIRALAEPACDPAALARPGHVLVCEARIGGVLQRAGRAEAALDLAMLAGRERVAAYCELTNPRTGELASPGELEAFAGAVGLPVVGIADLVRHRLERGRLVERVTDLTLPTRAGVFHCIAYRSLVDDGEHLALLMGDISGPEPVLARVQRSFPLDELLATGKPGISQLEQAMFKIAAEGRGALVYLRPYPDIGVGLVRELQDHAARREAQPSRPYMGYDERQHGIGAQILRDIGLARIRMLSDHPGSHRGLSGFGLDVVGYVPLS